MRALVLLLLIAAAYGGSLRNEFVFDDLMFVENDERVQRLSQAPRLFTEPLWAYVDREGAQGPHLYYRPLQLLPLSLSYALAGRAAWPCHLLCLALHWLNALLLFAIGRRLLERSAPALLAAAVFAVHPGHSEAVLWISDLAGLGAAASVLAIVHLRLAAGRGEDAFLAWGWRRGVAAAALLLVGLWFKETAVLGPALVLLHDALEPGVPFGRRLGGVVRRQLVFLPPFVAYLALRAHALGTVTAGLAPSGLPPRELVLSFFALPPLYLRAFLWPIDPSFYYPFEAARSVADARVLEGGALVAVGLATVLVARRSHFPFSFALGWALLAAAPHWVARLPHLNVFAERYLYLPASGALLAVSYAAARVEPRLSERSRRILAVLAGLVLVGFVAIDVRRAPDFHDNLTIYTRSLAQWPNAPLVENNLAVELRDVGRTAEATAILERTTRAHPEFPPAWSNLGLFYLTQGRTDEALSVLERAVRLDPGDAAALLNLGYLYEKQGRRDDAVAHYLRLVEVRPRSAKGWTNLAEIALEARQPENARRAAQRAVEAGPEDAATRALLARIEKWEADPQTPSTPQPATIARLAKAKALIDARLFREAITTLRVASWLDERAPLPYHFLANAYYLSGRLGEAADAEREALARAPQNDLFRRNLTSLEAALPGKAPSP